MKQETKDTFIFWLFVVMKLLISVRTGIDTFIVSGDILNVILLDGFFLAFWVVLAYGGKSAFSLAVRPVAAGIACAMYGFMVAVGLNAHVGMGLVSTAVRIGGAGLLIYDCWTYVVAVRQFFSDRRKTLAEEQRDMRKEFWRWAYKQVVKEARKEFKAQARQHVATDMLTDGDLWSSLPVLEETKRLPSRIEIDDRERPRTTANDRITSANRDTWASVFPSLPDRFTRSDVEIACDCKKTLAVQLISIGKIDGDVVEIGRGVYRKQVVVDGEAVESPSEGF